MNKNIVIGILSFITLLLVIILVFNLGKDTNDKESIFAPDIKKEDQIFSDLVEYKDILLPFGTKVYDNNNKKVKIKISDDLVYMHNQYEKFKPAQQYYSIFLPEGENNFNISLNDVKKNLDVRFIQKDDNILVDSVGYKEINKEIYKLISVFMEIEYRIDKHEKDYEKYIAKDVYQNMLKDSSTLDAFKNLYYPTDDELKKFQEDLDSNIIASCQYLDLNHIKIFAITSKFYALDCGSLYLEKEKKGTWKIIQK